MLTIGRLASYAGVTVRAIHHYHHRGLLPEPARDASGYRRYDAASVAALLRIRALTDAGVPLAQVNDLLDAEPAQFEAALTDIDRRLRAEIRAKHDHRRRIAQLAAGDNLALPPEAVDYLDHLRKLGLPDQMIDLERNAWILVAAQMPEQMPTLMALKRAQLDNPAVINLYDELLNTIDWQPDDPRVPALADRLAALLDAVTEEEAENDYEQFDIIDDELVDLLDSVFLNALPISRRLLTLLEDRGWTGWTRLERADTPLT